MKSRRPLDKGSLHSVIESLEPRLLYSATIDVVLVDGSLHDQEMLAAATQDADFYYVYDSSTDSLSDIVAKVSQWSHDSQSPIDSLSIISHGSTGSFELGSETVTTDSISAQSDIWKQLGDALATDANVYLFGCETGADGAGQALLDQLASATDADVFASNNLTGAGGDWELEVASQGDEHELMNGLMIPVSTPLLKNFSSTLTSTGWQDPSAASGNWNGEIRDGSFGGLNTTNPALAYTNDNNRIAPGDQNTEQFYNYGLNVTAGAAINGIEIAIDAYKPHDWPILGTYDPSGLVVSLSWDGGTSWTATKTVTWQPNASNNGVDVLNVYGSTSDTWGRTWTAAELSDANFRVKVFHNGQTGLNADGIEMDWIGARVEYNENPTTSGLAGQNLQEDFSDYTIDLKTIFADLETTDANLIYGVSGNSNIGVSIDGNGIATISSATANWNGTENITFTAQDAGGLTVSTAAAFNVAPVNDAPVLTGDLTATMNEGATYTLQPTDLGFTDVDDSNAGVTFSISNAVNGKIQVNGVDATTFTGTQLAAGQVTFIHDSSETSTAAFDVNVDDGNEDSSAPVNSTFNFTVNPVNDAPVADGDILLDGLEEATSAVLNTGMLTGDTDAEGNTLTITHINGTLLTGGVQSIAVTNGTVNIAANNDITFTPDTNYVGAVSFNYTISDGNGGNSTAAVSGTITNVNDAPVLTGDLTASMNEGATYTLQPADLGFTDVDDVAAGVTFTVSNAVNGKIQVNGVDATTFTGTQLAAGQVTFIHDSSETSTAAFDVNVDDGNEDSSAPVNSTFNFTINAVNDAPVLTGDLTASMNEGATYTLQPTDLGFTDVDDVAAGVTFTISNAVNGKIQVNGVDATTFTGTQLAAGQVTFIHDSSETSTAAFDVNVDDGNEDSSAPVNSTFNFTINAVNDAPVLTGDLTAAINEGATYTLQPTDLGYTDTDDVAAGVTFTISNAVNGKIQVNGVDATTFTGTQLAAGQVTLIHDSSETTTAAFDVNVDDGNEDSSAPVNSTFNFTINAVNDAPVLTGDLTATMNEGATYTLQPTDLGFTDTDDVAAGVTFSISNAVNGKIQVNGVDATTFTGTQLAAGQVTFIHDSSETSTASFDVNVDDGNEDSSAPVNNTFNFTVNPVNDAPVLTGDLTASMNEGATYTLQPADLGFTDTDDVAGGVTFTISNAVNGKIQVNGVDATTFTGTQLAAGQVTFIHDSSETSTAAFDVNVDDGNEDSSAPVNSTFNFTVGPINDAPVLTGDLTASMNEGATYTLQPTDLGFTDTDDVAAGVTFTISNAVNGKIQVNGVDATTFTGTQLAAGQVTFIHDSSETTTAAFDVNVDDGNEDSSAPVNSTFNFTVNPINDAPVLTGDLAATINEGATYTLQPTDLGFTDTDDVAAGVTFTISNAINGKIQVNGVDATTFTGTQLAAGQVTFIHDSSETSTAAFDVNVDDGNEDSSAPTNSTFNFTINAVNDAPVLTGDLTAAINEGATYTLQPTDLGFTDTDDVAAGVTFTISNAVNGKIQVNGVDATTFTGTQLAAGQVTFIHDSSETSTAAFDVNVDDGNEDSSAPANSTFNFTVNPVNDAPVLTGDLTSAINEGATYTLQPTDLGFTDTDDVAAGVTFTISNAVNGKIQVNGVDATTFTGTQLAAGQVTFIHDSSETSTAAFDVSVDDGNEDSSAPANSTFNFTVTPVNDAPVLTGDLTAAINEGATYTLQPTDLGFTDTDDVAAGVTFSISNAINGKIQVNGVDATTFTGTQLAAGQVTFIHDSSETSTATFDVNVDDGNEDSSAPTNSTFNFTINAVNDAPVLTGDLTATINEGATYTLQPTDLGFTDTDDVAAGVTFTISNAINGKIQVNGVDATTFTGTQLAAGQVTFIHDSSETTTAAFDVNVDDGNEDSSAPVNSTFNFTISPVNDAPVLTGDLTASINEGATYTLQPTDLGFTDTDDVAAGVTFTISNAINGKIQVNGVDATTFTGTQLTAGQVTFIHDSSETTTATFDVNVDDGNEDASAPVNSTFNFTVTPVNDAPTNSGFANQNLFQGFSSYTIDLSSLFSDAETASDQLIFSVQGNSNIQVTIDAQGVATISSTESWYGTERITITATDAGGLSTAISADFIVTPIPPTAPPETSGTDNPASNGNAPTVNDSPAIDHAQEGSGPSYAGGLDGIDQTKKPEADTRTDENSHSSLDLSDFLGGQGTTIDAIVSLRDANDTYLRPGGLTASDDQAPTSGIHWLRAQLLELKSKEITITTLFEETEFYKNSGWLWNKGNDSDQYMRKNLDNDEATVQIVKMAAGLSMMLASLWLGRAAAFGASLFAAIPAWRNMDPIAVLPKKKRPNRKTKDEEDNSDVEKMFSQKP